MDYYSEKIYTAIDMLYPNDPHKQQILIDDFNNWINGVYELPETKEIRELILKYEGENNG